MTRITGRRRVKKKKQRQRKKRPVILSGKNNIKDAKGYKTNIVRAKA